MTNYMKPIHDEIAERFGLGSSTRGDPALVNGERRDDGRTVAEAKADCALARLRRDHETPSEREARERREDAREHSTETVMLHVADGLPKFSDGIARKCFTCKGWMGGGWQSCTVHGVQTQTHLICNAYERDPSRYPALPAGEPTGLSDMEREDGE